MFCRLADKIHNLIADDINLLKYVAICNSISIILLAIRLL
jgi:hypothetical protein